MQLLEKIIPLLLNKNIHFAMYSLPGSDTFKVLIEDPRLKNKHDSTFVLHPFQVSAQHPVIHIAANIHINAHEIDLDFISKISTFPSGPTPLKQEIPKAINLEKYLQDLKSAMFHMRVKKIDKFIYSRVKTVENTRFLDLAKYLISLNEKHKTAYTYLVNHKNSGTWIGATPESLARWENGKINTMSLAGTQPKAAGNISWSEKEMEEQAYVTRYIEQSFKTHKIPYQSSAIQTVAAGPVAHLQTKISSKQPISFQKAFELANALHPTPAICGVPKQEALDLITQIEKHNRSYYAGYLGFVSPEKELQLFVNLRCMQVFPNHLALYLGGGITAKSDVKKEWDETNFKAQTLLDILPVHS